MNCGKVPRRRLLELLRFLPCKMPSPSTSEASKSEREKLEFSFDSNLNSPECGTQMCALALEILASARSTALALDARMVLMRSTMEMTRMNQLQRLLVLTMTRVLRVLEA